MAAYLKCYLDEIVETQGKLFEYVADATTSSNVDDFIEKYMRSKTRSYIDRADAYVSNMDVKSLFEYFCRVDGFKLQAGSNFAGFAPNWIGQFYAYYQWHTNLSSREVIERLPLDFMQAAYLGLHDLDLALAVEKIINASAKYAN